MLVIAIHVSPLENASGAWTFWIEPVLLRLAVPIFFAISGMGAFGGLEYQGGKIVRSTKNRRKLWGYWKKILILYVGWSAVYFLYALPGWYKTGWWGWTLVKDFASAFLFHGSHYHLWYLMSLLWAVPVLYAMLHIVPKNKLIWLIVPLWLIECSFGAYAWIGADAYPAIVSRLLAVVPGPIHAVFRGVPLLAVGMLAKDSAERSSVRKNGLLTAAFGMVYIAEAAALYYGPQQLTGICYWLATPVFVFFALRFALSGRQVCTVRTAKVLRYGSTLVYCVHPLISYVWCAFTGEQVPCVQWLSVTIISTLIGLGYGICRSRFTIGKKDAAESSLPEER